MITILLSAWTAVATARASDVWAWDLLTTSDAEDLCVTSDPLPPEVEGLSPLQQSEQRRHYIASRNSRVMEAYLVRLEATQFSFIEDDPLLLTVDTRAGFSLFGGELALALEDGIHLAFPVDPKQTDVVRVAHATGQVLLRVYFQLSALDHPEEAYCRAGEVTTTISGRLLAAEIADRFDGRALARIETERYARDRIRLGLDAEGDLAMPQPRVQVTNTAFPEALGPEEERRFFAMEAETRMMPCYLRGLSSNGRLQGALVVTFHVDRGGAVANPTLSIDAVDVPMVTGCALSALGEMALPRVRILAPYDLRMTVIFSLDPPLIEAPP